jgi:hypothetical protein
VGQRVNEVEAGTEDTGGVEAGIEDASCKTSGRRWTAWASAQMAADGSGWRVDDGRAKDSGAVVAWIAVVGGGAEVGGGSFGSKFLQSDDTRGEVTGARGKN